MKKDLDKLLSRTLLTYGTILFVVFTLKLFGLNYFGLDMNNKVINVINNFILYWRLENIWRCITLFINGYVIFSITCKDNSKKMKYYTLLTMLVHIPMSFLQRLLKGSFIFPIFDFLYLFILCICYIKFIKKEKIQKYNIGNYLVLTLWMNIFQIISIITRNIDKASLGNFLISNIMSFDYLILCIMIYRLYFIKGGISLCGMVHSSFSDLLISLKKLPTKFLKSYKASKPTKLDNELAYKIYLVLFWLYNFFTVGVVLLIAFLNDTFIECIFILSSFWINKGVFGKAFHLKKASTCFVVSSLSYYVLNRLTWNIGISFLIPVILGIALSYITSLFMARRENMYLYRGMNEDDFYKLIKKVTENVEHIGICKMFYVEKKSIVEIAIKYNYSEINIKKIKKKINDKIKELYQ